MLNDLLKEFELTEYASKIESITVDCFEGKPKVGKSKAGGLPDVDPQFKWPFSNEMPLEFVVQIN